MKPFAQSKLSIVSPVYKNEKTVEELARLAFEIATPLFKEIEYIFVNDGSPDNSHVVLKKMALSDRRIKVVTLARNFGQHTALMVGLNHTHGDYVLLIDADLEERPEYLVPMLKKIEEGHEIAIGKRDRRRRSFFKSITAAAYIATFNILSDYKLIDDATNMRLMTRKYAEYIKSFPEKPFIGGFTAWIGLPPGMVPVTFAERKGASSYTLRNLLGHARVGLLGFSNKPIRMGFIAGLIICSASFLFAAFSLLRYLIFKDVAPGYTSIVTLFTFLLGMQFIFVGIVGEYVGEIFISTKNRPSFLIYDKTNFEE